MSIAIKFENISKQYRLGLVSTRTLSHDLNRWWQINMLRREDPYLKIGEVNDRAHKGTSEYVWALKDINFEVEQGDVVGIIGKNGAGKSTLLKILSKVTTPTTGSIKAKGRIASLLEVGTGFHPEMTGRENIYMNGAIMGMSKSEIGRKFDEIVDFAGVERYLDTPVKRYSSGMTVRLGFAIAAHLDPEILVVDEVLAVGDAEFQKKAIGKMQDVSKGEGRTVLFVSHNMGSIKMLCNRGILLKYGSVDFTGDIDSTVDTYLKTNLFQSVNLIDTINKHSNILKIESFRINGATSNEIFLEQKELEINVELEIKLLFSSRVEMEATLYDSNNVLLASYCPGHLKGAYKMHKEGKISIKESIMLPQNITKGEYFLDIQLTDPNVAYFITLKSPVKLNIEGCMGESAMAFQYKERGFVML
jgi:lipopolysaccharide transport system ATP-binding protein